MSNSIAGPFRHIIHTIFLIKLERCLKRIYFAIGFFSWFIGLAQAGIGDIAPDFTLKTADNSSYTLSQNKNKVIYLDFWASWCGPCKKSFPWMSKMQAKFPSTDFEVIAVNLDERMEDAQAFLKQTPAQFKVLFDSKGGSAKLYEVKGMPTSFLIDKNGKILFEHRGFQEHEALEMEKKIKAAIDSSAN